jgi:hypothetical protein
VTRYAECASNSCKRAANSNGNSKEGCPRKYKIEFCTNSNITKYFMQGEHLVPDRLYFLSPTKYKVSRYTEEFMKGMIKNGFQPKTIFSKIVNNPAITDKPTLNFVQSYVHRARADGNDEVKEVRDTLKNLIKTDNMEPQDSFLIGVDLDEDGKPQIGVGSDLDPFVAGLSSESLLLKLKDFPPKFVPTMFHLDSTYKITKNSYPLLIFGVSDVNRKFFLLAAFIVSQTTAEIVKHCISSLQSTAANLVPDLIRWAPDYVMSDADPAHLNAVTACFGINVPFCENTGILGGIVSGYAVKRNPERRPGTHPRRYHTPLRSTILKTHPSTQYGNAARTPT